MATEQKRYPVKARPGLSVGRPIAIQWADTREIIAYADQWRVYDGPGEKDYTGPAFETRAAAIYYALRLD